MSILIIIYLWTVGAAAVYCLFHALSNNHPMIKFVFIWLWPVTVPVLVALVTLGWSKKMDDWVDRMRQSQND